MGDEEAVGGGTLALSLSLHAGLTGDSSFL